MRLELRPTSYSSGTVIAAGYNPADNYSGQITLAYNRYLGRMPTSVEMDLWMRRFAELRYSRMELLNQLKMQSRS